MKNEQWMDSPLFIKYVDEAEIDVPENKVQDEIHMMQVELKHNAQYSVMCGENDMLTSVKEMDEAMQEIPQKAYHQVKTELVLDRVIRENNLMPSEEEVKTEAERISKEKNIPLEMMEKFFGKNYALLVRDLQVRMAAELICEG